MILIIPDIHGRTFWKEAVESLDADEIVFLGDYLDPYPHEKIAPMEAFENFKEIIEFKKNNPNKVTLLLGNHDWHYIFREFDASRKNHKHFSQFHTFYMENLDHFKIGIYRQINGILYTFSHAAIDLKKWANTYNTIFGDNPTVESVIDICNDLLFEFNDIKYRNAMFDVSYIRGGWCPHSSILWCDVREVNEEDIPDNVYQIFGHTQLADSPIITKKYADLDVRKAFILTDDGEIRNIDNTIITQTENEF